MDEQKLLFPLLFAEMPRPKQTPKIEVESDVDFTAGPRVLKKIYGAAECVGMTIAYWSEADLALRESMELLLGVDPDISHALIDSLRTDDHVAILLPVVQSICKQNSKAPVFNKLLEKVIPDFLNKRRELKRIRDLFAHGSWAIRSDFPDLLVLQKADFVRDDKITNQEILNVLRADKLSKLEKSEEISTEIRKGAAVLGRRYRKTEFWSSADFIAAKSAASDYLNTSVTIGFILASSQRPDAAKLLGESGIFKNGSSDK